MFWQRARSACQFIFRVVADCASCVVECHEIPSHLILSSVSCPQKVRSFASAIHLSFMFTACMIKIAERLTGSKMSVVSPCQYSCYKAISPSSSEDAPLHRNRYCTSPSPRPARPPPLPLLPELASSLCSSASFSRAHKPYFCLWPT